MKRLFLFILLFALFVPMDVFSQEDAPKKTSTRAFNSEEDRGWYFLNAGYGRWNPFGAYYQGRLYYKEPLFREQNTFWFADSAIITGIEQDLGPFSRTSAYLFFQPVIATSFELRVGYEKELISGLRPVVIDDPHGRYNQALPPFTGLNPKDLQPTYLDTNGALIVEFTPRMTMGGKAGNGMLALIYAPTMLYIQNFGMSADQYYYYGRESAVMKATDILWKHDISLGYAFTGTGWSTALSTMIDHVNSSGRLMRIGVFGAVSYEKALTDYPDIIPFFRGRIGTWVWDEYMTQRFAFQLNTGINWKFY
ncbi:MAG: hypothetical protein ACRCVN_04610 [Spirochaetia bacterium]